MTLKAKPGIGLDIARRTAPAPIYDVMPGKGSGGASKPGDPWWMDALSGLGAVGGLVTNQVEAWTDDKHDWRDYGGGLVEPIGKGAKSQWDNWWKGGDGFGYEDIPLLGTLTHVSNSAKKGSDILDNFDVKDGWGKTLGGVGIDIALDPLTWLTFGGASVLKAGQKTMSGTAKSIGKELNLGKVSYKNVATKAADKAYGDVLKRTGDAAQANKAQADVFATVQQRVTDAGKATRFKAQNARANIDIPFTKVTFQLGKKPANLQKSSPKIAASGANVLQRNLNDVGLVGSAGTDFVKQALGKTDLKELTYQEYKWLQGEIKRYGAHAARNPVTAPWKTADAAGTAKPFETGKFVPDMGGISPTGAKWADRVRALNPRAVGTRASGGIVNAQGDNIQNAFGAIRGSGRAFDSMSKEARSAIGDLTPVQQRVVEYMLEGQDFTKIPGVTEADGFAAAPAAGFLRKQYDEMAQAEGSVGALDNVRQSYAPHIINRSPEQLQGILQKYADDPELQRLSQVAGKNGFNQSRRSFDTLAQLDNYVADLGDQVAKATDPNVIAQLNEKINDVSTLFERDPLKAYQKRLHKSFKTRELNKLYRTMEEDGMMVRPDAKGSMDLKDYVKLDQAEAAKLGVPPGTLMQGEVKNALLKVNDLFTEQGMNKFLDNATAVTNMWKGLVTSYRPVHHFNNLIGNLLNNGLAGVDVKAYGKATATLDRVRRGKPKQEDLNLMKEAMQRGVFGQNHSDEYRRVFGDMPANKIRKLEQAVTGNKYANFMRTWLGDTTDNWSRLAHFISIKGKTGSADLAAQSVRKHLFNYSEQTKADRALRLAIPFWNWTKRNIPLQIESMARQPRYAQTYLRLQDASYEGQGERRQDQADFISEGYFMTPWHDIPLVNKLPWVGEDPKLRNPRAPVADLNNLGNPMDTLKFLASSATPWVKIPYELSANRNVFTGKAIDKQKDYTGEYSAGALGKYGVEQTGVFNDLYKIFSGTMNPLDAIFGRELDVRKE